MADLCYEYATKRYRSNCINWGILPFTIPQDDPFEYESGDFIYIPGIRKAVRDGIPEVEAKILSDGKIYPLTLTLTGLTSDEITILLEGSLINYYALQRKEKLA